MDENEGQAPYSDVSFGLDNPGVARSEMEGKMNQNKGVARLPGHTTSKRKGKKQDSFGRRTDDSHVQERTRAQAELKKQRDQKKNERKAANQARKAAQPTTDWTKGDARLESAKEERTSSYHEPQINFKDIGAIGRFDGNPREQNAVTVGGSINAATFEEQSTSIEPVDQTFNDTTSAELPDTTARSHVVHAGLENAENAVSVVGADSGRLFQDLIWMQTGGGDVLKRKRLSKHEEAKAALAVLDTLRECMTGEKSLRYVNTLSAALMMICEDTEPSSDFSLEYVEEHFHNNWLSEVKMLLTQVRLPRGIKRIIDHFGDEQQQLKHYNELLDHFEEVQANISRPCKGELERRHIRSSTKPNTHFLGVSAPIPGLANHHKTLSERQNAEKRRLVAVNHRRFGGANPLAVPVNSEYKLAPTPVRDPIFERVKALLGKHLPDSDTVIFVSHVGKSTLPYPPPTGAAMMKVAAIIDDESVAKAEPRLHEHLARWYLEAQNQIGYQYFKHNLAGCLGIQEPELQLFYSIACDRLPVSALEGISKARMAELGQDAVLRSTFPNLAMFFVNKCSATDCNPIHSAGLPLAHNVYPFANGFITQAPEHRLTASESMQGIELTAPSINTALASSSTIPSFLSMGDSSRMPQTIAQAPSTAISATWLPSPVPGHSTSDMPTWVASQDDAQPYFASQDHDAAIISVASNGSASQMLGVGEDIEVADVHPHVGEQPIPFAELSTLPPSSHDEASHVGPAPSYNNIDSGAVQNVSEDIVQQERTDDPGEEDVDPYWTLHARYERVLELETAYLDTHSQEAKTTKAALAKQASLVDTARKIIKHHKCIEDTTRHDADDEEEYIDWLNNEVCKNMSHANFLKLWRDNEANLNGVLNEDEDQEEIEAIRRLTDQLKKSAMGTEVKARQIRSEQLETSYIENIPSQEDDQETLDRKQEERVTLIQKLVKHYDRMHFLIAAIAEDQWDRYHQDWLAPQILSETTRDQAMVAWRHEHVDLLSTMDQGDDEEEVEKIKGLVETIENEDESAGEAEEEGGEEEAGDGEAGGGDNGGDGGDEGGEEEDGVDGEEDGDYE